MIMRYYYQYKIEETDLGYEIHNTGNDKHYFVTYTEEKGLTCNCDGVLKGKTNMCKHKKMIMKLFYLRK
jgi:hypothetical protein